VLRARGVTPDIIPIVWDYGIARVLPNPVSDGEMMRKTTVILRGMVAIGSMTLFMVSSSGAAHADVLCVPATAQVNKRGQLSLGSRMVVRAACLKNEVAVLDTAKLGGGQVTGTEGAAGAQGPKGDKGDIGATGPQGPKGDTGAPGLGAPSYSACHKKAESHIYNSNGSRLILPNFQLTCDAGEYAYYRKDSLDSVCSSTWSYRWDDDDQATASSLCDVLHMPTSNKLLNRVFNEIFDASETFVIGHSVEGFDRGIQILSGTISVTRTITLTCCALGD